MVLDRMGIESKLVMSINNVLEYEDEDRNLLINHWMLVVSDGEKEYFCTLSSDLPYIQMGMETKHFAVHIPYKKELSDGTTIQIYEGEEIKHTVLSREQLKDIDTDINYIKEYYKYNEANQISKEWNLHYGNASLNMLRDCCRGNKLFYELEIDETDFINHLMCFEGEEGKKISFYDTPFSSITDGDWKRWIKIICSEVLNKLCDILGFAIYPIPSLESESWNYESWLLSLTIMIENEIYRLFDLKKERIRDFNIQVDYFKYNKWSKKLKQEIDIYAIYEHKNIIIILDKMNALINCVKSRGKNGNMKSLLMSLGYHFINFYHLYENNIDEEGELSSYYIANKFDKMLKKIFSCNEATTNFNLMSYSEQVVIIKDILPIIFPEISVENSKMVDFYDERYSPVLNRIQLYPVKSKITGDYSIIFSVIGDDLDEDFYFFYDLKANTFAVCNILDIHNDYIFVSNRMRCKLSVEELENVEERAIKK